MNALLKKLCIFMVALACGMGGALAADAQRPDQGAKVIPLKSPIPEEGFQTLLVMRALRELGYDVQPMQEIDYAAIHLALANGDGTFAAVHWVPLHENFYQSSGGDAKLFRKGVYVDNAVMGYAMDKKTADAHGITNIAQLKDPKIAQLFDTDGDGKADMAGCIPGWYCESVIDHQIAAYGLQETVTQHRGAYAAMIADVVARFRVGQPVLYYTWTPHWSTGMLRPGREVVWLQVPFSAMPPGDKGQNDTRLPNGSNYGFAVSQMRIVAHRAFTDRHPDAARLFEIMTLAVDDISAQNTLMYQGQSKPADLQRHAEAWIRAHQATFDSWLAQARAAAKQ